MSILLVSHSSNLYGAETSLLDLAEGLAEDNINFSVLCPSPGPFSDKLLALNIPVVFMPLPGIGTRSNRELFRFLKLFLPTVFKLSRWIQRKKVSLVYSNSINSIYGPIAAKITGVRSIWHIREVKPKLSCFTKIAGSFIHFFSTQTIFNSQATMRAFAKHPPRSWRVVYNGIAAKPVDRKAKSTFIIGFAGQMTEHKRPERFLYALSQVNKINPDIKGIMAGDGPLLRDLRSLAKKLYIDKNVEFPGYVFNLESFYATISVLVLTSDHEPFGRVILEAMSYGCPVVTADVGGVSEIVNNKQTGYLVRPNEISAYVHWILYLSDHPQICSKMGRAAQRDVTNRFSKTSYQYNLKSLITR